MCVQFATATKNKKLYHLNTYHAKNYFDYSESSELVLDLSECYDHYLLARFEMEKSKIGVLNKMKMLFPRLVSHLKG